MTTLSKYFTNKPTQHTSYFIKHINLPRKSQNGIHKFDTCSGAYLFSAATQHDNLHPSSVTTNRVTDFILQAYTGTGVPTANTGKNSGEVLEKNKCREIDRKG